MIRTVDIITKKREGLPLSSVEIQFLINEYVKGHIPDYQMSAWLMAVFFQGMNFEEIGYLTQAMIDSGDTIDLDGLVGPLVDKHSTGGVGDKVSFILAPLAASCGLQVPMMAGRALGHTGGTLDKLESITGYRTALNADKIRQGLAAVGYMITGQTEKMVPADRLLYALRDVTATVESIPLITASILSKKVVEGARNLIFDVKCGKGAFMKNRQSAHALAVSLVETAKKMGLRSVAILTNMNLPLGRMVGNFLEIEESIFCLRGEGPDDLMHLSFRLVAWMLVAGKIVGSLEEGEALAKSKIDNGEALQKFLDNVRFQGGDSEKLLKDLLHRRAPFYCDFRSSTSGYISKMDCFEIGLIATILGAGRSNKDDSIVPDVGLEFFHKTGDWVEKDKIMVRIWAHNQAQMDQALLRIERVYEFSSHAPNQEEMILEEIVAL